MAGKHAKPTAPRMRQLGVAAAATSACAGAFVALPAAAAAPTPAADGAADQFIPTQPTPAQRFVTVPQQRTANVQHFFFPAAPVEDPAAAAQTQSATTRPAQAEPQAAEAQPEPQAAPSRGQQVVDEAASHEGKPYEYGADGPDSFDCSGLTQYVYQQVGVELPRTSQQQYDAVEHLSQSEAQPGDLIFFSGGGGVYHVAIYAGGNQMWTAPQSGDSVQLDDIFDDYTVGRPG